MAKDLKRAGRVEDAAKLLEKLTDAYKARDDGPPGAWTDLAIIYRQRKDYAAEVALLESFMASKMARGLAADKMAERLEKARKLAAKKS